MTPTEKKSAVKNAKDEIAMTKDAAKAIAADIRKTQKEFDTRMKLLLKMQKTHEDKLVALTTQLNTLSPPASKVEAE